MIGEDTYQLLLPVRQTPSEIRVDKLGQSLYAHNDAHLLSG